MFDSDEANLMFLFWNLVSFENKAYSVAGNKCLYLKGLREEEESE